MAILAPSAAPAVRGASERAPVINTVETDSITRQVQETGEATNADLVAGILGEFDPDTVKMVCEGLRSLPGSPRIAIVQTDPSTNHCGANSTAAGGASLFFVPSPLAKTDTPGASSFSVASAYESVFAAGEKLGARACCVFASQIEGATPEWIARLVQPLLDGDADLVVPRYARHRLEGLLNSSLISPFARALYGKRIQNPMGPDLGISRRLLEPILGAEKKTHGGGVYSLASIAPAAVCAGFNVCEVHAGARVYPPTDWTNISSLISAVLGPIFQEMERNAACWQRTRGSVAVPAIGEPVFLSPGAENLDVARLVELFQLGNRELQEIWGLVLPPATLLELRKLLRLPAEQFHMEDAVWVRIVYDFALAHRLRTISRDHLLKSMTPLYLGWVASYARQVQNAGALAVDQRLERLALAYESAKPYLLSRWRWPDRFSP